MSAVIQIPTPGTRAPTRTSSRPHFQELRAQSERLRHEFIRNSLDLSLTLADYAQVWAASAELSGRCRQTAQKGYLTVLSMMANREDPGMPTAELMPKLDRLRHSFGSAAEPAPPPAAEDETAAPERAGSRVLERLTPRETEVLRAIANGESTKQVAYRLGISFKTAACHRYRIMDKLGLHEVASLVRYAIREGLVEP